MPSTEKYPASGEIFSGWRKFRHDLLVSVLSGRGSMKNVRKFACDVSAAKPNFALPKTKSAKAGRAALSRQTIAD